MRYTPSPLLFFRSSRNLRRGYESTVQGMSRTWRISRFTLIEVIIAVSLLVTVMGVLFLGTGTVMSSWEQLESHARGFEDMLSLDRTLDVLLSNVIPFTWPDEELEGRPSMMFRGESGQTTFAYIHSFNRLEDGAIRSCRLMQEKNELVAYYCERPPFPEDLGSDKLRRSVLARNIHSVSFSYMDVEDDRITFIDDWEDRDYMPLAILIRVDWIDGASQNWLRRTAGTSYFERWGKWEQKNKESK